MIDALIKTAEQRGYQVLWHNRGPKAAWLPHRRAVTVRNGMDDVQTLCALAHELGHAHYDDPPGHFGPQELRADRFAARLLVSPTEYQLAEFQFGPHPARLAHELGVTIEVLKTWQTLHQKAHAL